jgi:hypothetical protein
MEVTATVKVKSETTPEARPSRNRVEEVARLLRGAGFEVFHVGRFGVGVRAESPLFHSKLGVDVDAFKALVSPIKTTEPKLAALVESVEYAPPAEFYSAARG